MGLGADRDALGVRRRLISANVGLLAATALHDLDHVRQGRSLEASVIAVGIVGAVAAIVSLILAIRGSSLAPLAATAVGFGTALGFVAVHVLPDWGPFSDPYPVAEVDLISWLAVGLSIAAALWLGLTGLRATRRAPRSA